MNNQGAPEISGVGEKTHCVRLYPKRLWQAIGVPRASHATFLTSEACTFEEALAEAAKHQNGEKYFAEVRVSE